MTRMTYNLTPDEIKAVREAVTKTAQSLGKPYPNEPIYTTNRRNTLRKIMSQLTENGTN